MHELPITADEMAGSLLALSRTEPVCILDSCRVGHLGSHLLIAGIEPVETFEVSTDSSDETLGFLDEKLSGDLASIFTLSYDFGLKLLEIDADQRKWKHSTRYDDRGAEPDVFIAQFDVLIIHDYDADRSFLVGNADKFDRIATKLSDHVSDLKFDFSNELPTLVSNFTRWEYLNAIGQIKERIRCGDTYQTNLTQQITAHLPTDRQPETIFARLRRDHPAPFAAFINRLDSTVISASPERFIKIDVCKSPHVGKGETRPSYETTLSTEAPGLAHARACSSVARKITTSPIKGTRRRGKNAVEDNALKSDLLASKKDRAENTMIVDLLRNDLGRVCEYGSVRVETLCNLEEHPTLFHLVSTVSGDLRPEASLSDILKAVFPCGSITGAPKINTMKIIDKIETPNRGLSMGSIGCYIPWTESKVQGPWESNVQGPRSKVSESGQAWDLGLGTWDYPAPWTLDYHLEMSVAIRTMVIRGQTATFNVGGGIVTDSDPESEYEETLTKARALLDAIGAGKDHLR